MSKPVWPENCEIVTTADGSPTLAFRRADGYVEKMHHSAGALGESLFIYGEALTLAIDQGFPARVISIGLGLGYNELIALTLLKRRRVEDFTIHSFEALNELKQSFADWINGTRSSEVYDLIAQQLGHATGLESDDVRQLGHSALNNNKLMLHRSFPESAPKGMSATVVFYDAYSNKMDPHLWVEDFLKSLDQHLDRRCVFATYAATGALNRALKHLGFRLIDKSGYKGKRQSTLAVRE